MNRKDLRIIKDYCQEFGGITLSKQGKVITLNSGFMVSIKEHEKVLTISKLNTRILNKYLKLAISKDGFVGLWLDNGKLYLDISKNIINKQVAIAYAIEQEQLAIFDNFNRVCIYTK